MVRIAAVLYATLLLQLTAVAKATSPTPDSDQEGKQCLMQKKHAVSRSEALDVKPNLLQESEELAPTEQKSKKSKKHGKKETHPTTIVSSGQAQPSKPPHQKKALHKKKQGNGLVQKGLVQKAELEPLPKRKAMALETGRKKTHHKSRKNKKTKAAGLVQLGASGAKSSTGRNPALDLLPKPVYDLATKLFKDENAIAGCIENSVLVDITYAGVEMSLRMNKFDDATKRLGEEAQWFGYDLDTLGDVLDSSEEKEMLNMLDVGGNYGVVTIAAMKKHEKTMRVIAVEPIPETFFFLVWNLYINKIPVLDITAMKEEKHVPGVLALNSGSGDVAQDLHFCAYPWSSMNSKVCDCKAGEDNCHIVPSIAVDKLVGMFASDPIAMVKMDCEGCEFESLPALSKPDISKRVRRLAGELHLPDQSLEELACRWEDGRLMSKCQQSKKNKDDIECGVKLACPL